MFLMVAAAGFPNAPQIRHQYLLFPPQYWLSGDVLYASFEHARIVAWTLDKPHSGVFSGSGQDPPILCGPYVKRTNSLGLIFHIFFYITTLR
jgi:hypothetical protein